MVRVEAGHLARVGQRPICRAGFLCRLLGWFLFDFASVRDQNRLAANAYICTVRSCAVVDADEAPCYLFTLTLGPLDRLPGLNGRSGGAMAAVGDIISR